MRIRLYEKGNIMGTPVGAGKTEIKQGEISLQFVSLNERKEQLHDRIGILFDRLQEVMRQPEQPTQGATPEEALSSQFAKDLLAIRHTTESDIDKVSEIIDRLEL